MAQVEVTAFSTGANEGVTYFLPDTRLDITVDVQCVVRTPGEFARYADRFLRITDAVTSEEKEWILNGVDVNRTGVPNSSKAFTVKISESAGCNLVMTEEGIIQAANRKVEAKPAETVQKKEVTRVDPRKFFTEEILQATSTAKMAELVSREIYAIRESKLAITRGTADNMPKDGISMQLILDELNTQEKTLTELFTGRIDTLSYQYKVSFTPSEKSDTTRAVLFRFSRKLGLVDADNLAGSPIYYDFSHQEAKTPVVDTKKKKKEVVKEGICYIVPGRANLRIYITGKELFNSSMPIAQYGTVEVLSKELYTKRAGTRVLLDTATGSILSIEK